MRLRLKKRKNTIPSLFDVEYYLSSNEVAQKADCPWKHFCKVGFREGLDPNPLFSTRHYQHKYLNDDYETNPLLHYIESTGQTADPHPLFDSQNYLRQLGDAQIDIPLLEHFLKYNNENQISPSVFFDTKKYLFANPEVSPCGFVGLYHYVRYGKMQGRSLYIDQALIGQVFQRREQLGYDWLLDSPQREVRFLASILGMDPGKPTIVISANNGDSEYQAIIQQISRELGEVYEANVVHVFGFHPQDSDSFTPFGPTFCLNWDDSKSVDHEYQLECAEATLKNLDAVGLIYFDCHPSKTLCWLSDMGIPIHAVIPSIKSNEFQQIVSSLCETCETLSIPAKYESRINEFKYEQQAKLTFVDSDFNAIQDPQTALTSPAQIKDQMGLERDSLLIVGTGDIGYRCGFDRFVSVASSTLAESKNKRIQFLWVGQLSTHDTQAMSMIEELDQAQLGDQVLICEDPSLAQDAINSADILLMTHRGNSENVPIGSYLDAGRPMIWFKGHSLVDRIMANDPCEVSPGNMPKALRLIDTLFEDRNFSISLQNANRQRREKSTSLSDFVYSLTKPLALKTLEGAEKLLSTDEPQHILKMPALVRGSRKRRRVVFTAPNWQISGVNTFIETLVNELNKLDFEAVVLFTTTKPLTEQKSLLPDMPYQALTHTPNLKPLLRRQLLKKYLAAMAPCVFVPSYDYNSSTITPELQDNIATLGVLHSDDPQHYVHGYRMGPYWDQIVSVSSTIEKNLLALNASFQEKSTVIRYGIRDQEKSIQPRPADAKEKLRVVYTGRIIQQQKLIFDFVKVAERLNDYRNQIELIFVGDGPDFDEFQNQMDPYVRSGLVDLMGRIKPDRINEVLLSSHVFALTSEFEGLPLSMLEALSAGLVPAVTDIESGIGEICVHEKNAMISPIGDSKALSDNLLKLANSPSLFNSLSHASRATFIKEKLRAVDMAEQYAVVLDKMFDQISEAGCERTEKLIYCPGIERLLNVA